MSGRQLLLRTAALALSLAAVGLAAVGVGGTPSGALGSAASARGPVVPVSPRHQIGRSGLENSLNWAGYAVTGTTMTSVSGSWVVPTATCKKNNTQLDSTWVGIDGFEPSDPAVEQIGTDSDCAKTRGAHRGTPVYYAWFELYPAGAVLLPQASYPVAPGEQISGSVAVSGSTFLLTLTNGVWHYSTSQTSSGRPQDASAEWITEAPTNCRSSGCIVVQLTDFGALSFSGAQADGQAIGSPSFTSTQIDMANRSGRKLRAVTSALTAGGTAFIVTWLRK
jgi:Peptidase A4 family